MSTPHRPALKSSPQPGRRRWRSWWRCSCWAGVRRWPGVVAAGGAGRRPARATGRERRRVDAQREVIEELQQRVATLSRSDQISRDANTRRAGHRWPNATRKSPGLRADVAFYERLVGGSGPAPGPGVHEARLCRRGGAAAWHYHGHPDPEPQSRRVSKGEMRFAVEGVRGGKLSTVAGTNCCRSRRRPGKNISFRYFQQLGGQRDAAARVHPAAGAGSRCKATARPSNRRSPGR